MPEIHLFCKYLLEKYANGAGNPPTKPRLNRGRNRERLTAEKRY
jgi:hypothetical protein